MIITLQDHSSPRQPQRFLRSARNDKMGVIVRLLRRPRAEEPSRLIGGQSPWSEAEWEYRRLPSSAYLPHQRTKSPSKASGSADRKSGWPNHSLFTTCFPLRPPRRGEKQS